jgi:hypothetical protein
MNPIIQKGGLDFTLDETTGSNASYADVHGRLNGKKCDKGGQHVLLLDAQRRYKYAWTTCHKFFEIKQPFTAMGPTEVVCMIDIIKPLVKSTPMEPTDKRRPIFEEKVHVTMDNFFSGDEVLRFLGEGGWKAAMTCRRDRLPKEVVKVHFNYIKAAPVNQRSKVARFEQPIIAVKNILQLKKKPTSNELVVNEKKDYVNCHVSFQSTGGTNITSVNALSNVELYVREQNKGRGNQKRSWGIVMNQACETYPKAYSAADKIDQMLLEWEVNYRSWRWWYAPARHAKAFAVSMAYCLYKHCTHFLFRQVSNNIYFIILSYHGLLDLYVGIQHH